MNHQTALLDLIRSMYAQAIIYLDRAKNELHPEVQLAHKQAGVLGFSAAMSLLDQVADPVQYLSLYLQSEKITRKYLLPGSGASHEPR